MKVEAVTATAVAFALPLSGILHPQQAIDQPIPQIDISYPESDIAIPLRTETPPKANAIDNFARRIEKEFGISGNDLMKEISGQDRPAYAWSLANLIEAYRTASLVPGVSNEVKNLYQEKLFSANRYWDSGISGPGYDPDPDMVISPVISTDDTSWIGIQELRKGHIERAKQALGVSISQWDQNLGGVYWHKQGLTTNRERGTVSTALASILSSGLYEATGDPKYLKFAKRTLDWVLKNMVNERGLIRDHDEVDTILPPDTTHQNDVWPYNAGLTAEAIVLLNESLPDKYPLSMAVGILDRSLDYFKSKGYGKYPSYLTSWFFKFALGVSSKVPDNAELREKVLEGLNLAIEEGPKHSPALIFHASMLMMQALRDLDPSQYYLLIDRPPETRYQLKVADKSFKLIGNQMTIYDPNITKIKEESKQLAV